MIRTGTTCLHWNG